MSEYLNYTGLTKYDEQIKAYINSVSGGSNGVKVVQLDSAPTSSTLTYEINNTIYNFKKGDEAIVADNTKGTESTNYFVVYKLYDIANNTAYWALSGSGGGDIDKITEKAVITLTSADYSSELIGASVVVTVDGTPSNYTWNGTSIEVNIPYGVAYSVSVGNKAGFTKPTDFQVSNAVMGFQRNITMSYTYSEVQVTVGTNQSNLADLVSGNATLTMAGNSFVVTNSESNSQVFKTHVAIGDSVSFVFTDVNGYKTPTIANATASSNLTYSVNYETTVVSVTSVVDSTGGKSSSDVTFTVNGASVASGDSIKIATGSTITISSTDLSSFGYGVSISPVSGTVATGANMTFTATYAYGSVFTAQILSNQSNDTSLSGESISLSYDSVSETLTNGQTLVIPPGKNVTCVFSNINTDYKKPSNLVFTTVAGTNFDCTSKIYQTEVLTLSSMTTDAGSITGQTVTVNGVTKTYGTDTMSWKIPFDASDTVTTSKAGFNVTITKNPNTDIADSVSKDLVIAFAEVKNGVYAITNQGVEVAYANIDSSNQSQYVGVVVRDTDNNIEFFIDKRFPTGSSASATTGNYKAWATNNYSVDISGITNISGSNGNGNGNYWSSSQISQAQTLHKNGETGIANTDKIVAQYTSDTAANNAAKYCRSIANPITGEMNGYLGSAAEWIAVHTNLTQINNTLSAIGGVQFSYNMSGDSTDTRCWTSTEYASNYAWYWYWFSSYSHPYFNYNPKSNSPQNYCARTFFPVK